MNIPAGSVLAALAYTVLLAGLAGAVLVDSIYFRLIRNSLGEAQRAAVSRELSDILLLLALPVAVAGCVAAGSVWQEKGPRYLFLLSLAMSVGMEFLFPVLAPLLPVSRETLDFLGPKVRVLSFAGAVLLAMIALDIHVESLRADGRRRSREIGSV